MSLHVNICLYASYKIREMYFGNHTFMEVIGSEKERKREN